MPCKKCDNGKWKWGENGECKYTSKDACEKANPKHYESLKNTKIVELIISDESQELTIDAISLVTSPAIEQNFVFFGKEKNNLTLAKIDEEKRMLVSPALIPNKQIFRHDPNTDSDYYVYFSKETVRQAAELYLRHNNHHKATYQHEDRVSGILTIESWIKEGDQDKSKLYGYDLPNGTWFVKMKIENDEMWEKIKEGELKGLSIEGYFIDKMEKMGKQEPTTEQILSALNEMIQSKTELKAEKIELGLMDDIEKQTNKGSAEFEELVKESKQVRKLVGRLTTGSILLRKTGEKLESMVNEMEKALKTLGVDKPPKQFLVAKSLYKMFIKQGERMYDQYGKLD